MSKLLAKVGGRRSSSNASSSQSVKVLKEDTPSRRLDLVEMARENRGGDRRRLRSSFSLWISLSLSLSLSEAVEA